MGALVQFLLDEKDRLLERLEAEEAATIALIDENLKLVESEAAKVDKAIAEIQNHLSEVANFEVCLTMYLYLHNIVLYYFEFLMCSYLLDVFFRASAKHIRGM